MSGLDIEGVLSAHEYEISYRPTSICRCGFSPSTALTGTLTPQQDYHRAHVAAVLREQVDAWLGSEWAREEVADAMLDCGHNGFRCYEPAAITQTAEAALGRLAAHLSDTERAGDAE